MGIAENVSSRKAAEQLLKAMLDVARDDYRKLDQHGKRVFCEMAYAKFAGMLGLASKPAEANEREGADRRKQDAGDIERAYELCDEILSLAEDVPSEGIDFAESVCESCREVRGTIEKTGRVSERQMEALENWLSGLQAWARD